MSGKSINRICEYAFGSAYNLQEELLRGAWMNDQKSVLRSSYGNNMCVCQGGRLGL